MTLLENIKRILRPLTRFIRFYLLEVPRLLTIYITRRLYYKPLEERDGGVQLQKFKYLFNTQYTWDYSTLEYMTASQLSSLGHDTLILACDGLPYCERETYLDKRPSCKSCFNQTKRHCQAYGLKYEPLSNFLDEEDIIFAKEKSKKEDINFLRDFKSGDLEIGKIAERNYWHYVKGTKPIVGKQQEKVFRKCIEAAILIDKSSTKFLKEYKPDFTITANGKFLQTAIPALKSKSANSSFFTYEVFGQGDGAILEKNGSCVEQRMDAVWDTLKEESLSDKEKERLYHSFHLQSKSLSSPFQLWDKSIIESKTEILDRLNLEKEKKLLVAFPNVTWDSTCMGLEAVEVDIKSWLESMIHFVNEHNEFNLVIRAHPGETKVPFHLRTTYTVINQIKDSFSQLPKNVTLVDSDNPISSYSIAELADACLVWNGTIGIELCLRGIKPIVVADAYYSQKGFTEDLLDKKELFNFLLSLNEKPVISEEQLRLVEVFAYNVRFRRKFLSPYYRGTKPNVYNFKALLRNKNTTLDNMVDFFQNKRGYLDIGSFNI